ncbi:MAG: spore maturation protein [Elusimicrobia bacterium]|nr:spore maturation protein [Candidatus Liberimonas magnetica]
MNIIWYLLILVSIIFAALNNNFDAFTKSFFDGAKSAVEISIFLLGIVSLWMGLTKIIEDSGLVKHISRLFRPFIHFLFRDIPKDHPSIISITLNLMANFLGVGNAATPLGIKAMKDLQELNPNKEEVSFEMMLFIVINTASIQLIPFTVIGILADYGSIQPTKVIAPTIISTFISAALALGILFLFKKVYKWKS